MKRTLPILEEINKKQKCFSHTACEKLVLSLDSLVQIVVPLQFIDFFFLILLFVLVVCNI